MQLLSVWDSYWKQVEFYNKSFLFILINIALLLKVKLTDDFIFFFYNFLFFYWEGRAILGNTPVLTTDDVYPGFQSRGGSFLCVLSPTNLYLLSIAFFVPGLQKWIHNVEWVACWKQDQFCPTIERRLQTSSTCVVSILDNSGFVWWQARNGYHRWSAFNWCET